MPPALINLDSLAISALFGNVPSNSSASSDYSVLKVAMPPALINLDSLAISALFGNVPSNPPLPPFLSVLKVLLG